MPEIGLDLIANLFCLFYESYGFHSEVFLVIYSFDWEEKKLL